MKGTISVHRLASAPHYEVSGIPTRLHEKIQKFFELSIARGFSIRTVRAYAFDLLVFFRFYQRQKKILPPFSKISIGTLNDFVLWERGRNAAPRSINRRLNTVNVVFRHCFRKEIPGTTGILSSTRKRRRFLTMDSQLGIYPIFAKSGKNFRVHVPHKLIETLEPSEIKTFLTTFKTHRDFAIVALMLVCGLRSMEVLNLRLQDIDSLSRALRIRGKGAKERSVPLTDEVLEILNRYIEIERPVKPRCNKEEVIFLTAKGPKRGMPMCLEGLRGLFRYKRALSGISHANPHRFRHTFGKNMVTAGMSLPSLQKLLGHKDVRTTTHYVNLVLKDVFEDFEKTSEFRRELYGQALSAGPQPV